MKSGSLLIVVLVCLTAAPLRGEVRLALSSVDTESGETFYLAERSEENDDRLAERLFVVLDAPAGCVGKDRTLTLVHTPEDGEPTSFDASFTVALEGLQRVLVEFPSPLATDAEWWVKLKGESPLPVPKRIVLRETTDTEQAKQRTKAAVQQPAVSDPSIADGNSLGGAFVVVRPSTIVKVPRHRILPLPRRTVRYVRPVPVARKNLRPLDPRKVGPVRPVHEKAAKPKPAIRPVGKKPARVKARPGPRRGPARGGRRR
ncbi:MAG: hypothetical protein ABII12_07100 [Planctomycetota bacterium]